MKCKLQAVREQNRLTPGRDVTAVKMTSEILKKEGVAGLFRGLSSTMAREMPGYFFFFGGYEVSKLILTKGHPEQAGLPVTIVAGGVGGVCLWTSIFPFDVVKSRIQIQSSREKMITVLLRILRTEGIQGLYNGLTPTLLRTFPSTGALFVAYEYSRQFMLTGVEKVSLFS